MPAPHRETDRTLEACITDTARSSGSTRLQGRRVVVTRPSEQAGELIQLLEAHGAEVVVFPTIMIGPPADPEPLRRAIRRLDGYHWLLFTSANGVRFFFDELERLSADEALPAHLRIACVGPATAASLSEYGVDSPVEVPESYTAESLLVALGELSSDTRILLPQADIARPVLADGLREAGAEVDVVEAYRTLPTRLAVRDAGEVAAADVVTFTSPSTVRNFVELAGKPGPRMRVAVIGPVTAAAARASGMTVHARATEHTVAGLVDAVLSLFGSTP